MEVQLRCWGMGTRRSHRAGWASRGRSADWFYEAQVQVVPFAPSVPMPPLGEARFPVRPSAAPTANDSLVIT